MRLLCRLVLTLYLIVKGSLGLSELFHGGTIDPLEEIIEIVGEDGRNKTNFLSSKEVESIFVKSHFETHCPRVSCQLVGFLWLPNLFDFWIIFKNSNSLLFFKLEFACPALQSFILIWGFLLKVNLYMKSCVSCAKNFFWQSVPWHVSAWFDLFWLLGRQVLSSYYFNEIHIFFLFLLSVFPLVTYTAGINSTLPWLHLKISLSSWCLECYTFYCLNKVWVLSAKNQMLKKRNKPELLPLSMYWKNMEERKPL